VSRNIVIIPTYNEIENIGLMLDAVFDLSVPFDVLIIDDGSPDGTADVVKKRMPSSDGRLHLLERKGKLGLGTAYIAGFKWCLERDYDFIFEMDCDFSHNPKDLLRLLDAASEADVVVGSRYVDNLVNVVNWPMGRVLLSYFASFYVRMITSMKVMDTTAGFVCFRRQVLETINLDGIRFKGYAFQIEMKFTAVQAGFKLKEIPIIFTDRTRGSSKMSSGIIKEALFGVLQLKLRSLFNRKSFGRKSTN